MRTLVEMKENQPQELTFTWATPITCRAVLTAKTKVNNSRLAFDAFPACHFYEIAETGGKDRDCIMRVALTLRLSYAASHSSAFRLS